MQMLLSAPATSGPDQFKGSTSQFSNATFIDVDAEAGAANPHPASTVAECQILFSQPVFYKEAIKTAFQITNACDIAGKMATSGREDTGFANLTSELELQSGCLSHLGESQ
jgi:hypothetical protein